MISVGSVGTPDMSRFPPHPARTSSPSRPLPPGERWGVARFLVEAIRSRDYPIVQNLVMFIALVVVIVNFLVDMAYVILDPRIKYED